MREIRALPTAERARVIEFVHQLEEAEIPASFKQAMSDLDDGRVVDMATALNQPPSRQ